MSLTKKPAGRPRVMLGRVVNVNIRMTEEQRDRLRALGGARWVREQIDRAREPGAGGA